MRRRNNCKIAVLLMTACFVFAGCKEEQKSAPVATGPAKAVPPKVQGQASSAKNSVPRSIQKQASSAGSAQKAVQLQLSSTKRPAPAPVDFTGKKDPFKPYLVPVTATAKKDFTPVKIGVGLPIQRYDVSKFKLEGIVAGLKENRALIVDPMRKGYVVKAGMPLGSNNGRITRVTSDAVEVLEQFRDDDGKIRKRTVRLVLPQKSKESVR